MSAVEYILDGLEAALELERELGVRSVEIDRGLLGALAGGSACPQAEQRTRSGTDRAPSGARDNRVDSVDRVVDSGTQTPADSKTQTISELVFLHDRPLTPAGVEMMAKILNALGNPDAPIVVAPPVPEAKVTVVLGGLALKKYFPGMKGEPGQWQKTPEGRDVLITYSPAYILRFGTVTPAVEKIKQDMWRSLKAVRQRLSTS